MSDIHHRISIQAEPASVYSALSTLEGLAGWWTTTTTGGSELGETLEFRFGDHLTTMEVEELERDRHVQWRCTGSHPQWHGTRVSFTLEASGEKTFLRFGHHEWENADDFFAHCSTKWATFLISLKELVETGTGRPFPQDRPV